MSEHMKLHIIGVGTPDPNGERFGSAFVLEVQGRFLMIDCGPSAVYKMAKLGIMPAQIDRLLFTHQHFDHNADYPCFLLTRWDQDTGDTTKTRPLVIMGPSPTCEVTQRLIGKSGAFEHDIKARLNSPASHYMHTHRGGSLPRWWPTFDVRDVEPGVVEENEHWKITAYRVAHMEPWLIEYGYRVETPLGTVAFTGDAGPCDALDDLARGAQTLVMCSAHQGNLAEALMEAVTGAPDVAAVAQRAGVKRAVLTHMHVSQSKGDNHAKMIKLASQGFEGQVILPEEVTTIELT